MKKKHKTNDVVKALRKANREIELERNGYAHPWIAVNRKHKDKSKYDRKAQKKELRNINLSSFSYIKRARKPTNL